MANSFSFIKSGLHGIGKAIVKFLFVFDYDSVYDEKNVFVV